MWKKNKEEEKIAACASWGGDAQATMLEGSRGPYIFTIFTIGHDILLSTSMVEMCGTVAPCSFFQKTSNK